MTRNREQSLEEEFPSTRVEGVTGRGTVSKEEERCVSGNG